ncbi:MAG: hypothetical protein RLZZ232_718 [Planctomycetota bacterium]
MPPRIASILVSLTLVSGCAGLASTRMLSSNSSGEAAVGHMTTAQQVESDFRIIDPEALRLELTELQTGQQVRLVAFTSPPQANDAGLSSETVEYVGTIEAIDSDRIVLKDASLVTSANTVARQKFASRVPYFNRMFKTPPLTKENHRLPQGVSIPFLNVVAAARPGSSIEIMERIGVDFGHESDNGESSVKKEVVVVLIHQSTNESQPE